LLKIGLSKIHIQNLTITKALIK